MGGDGPAADDAGNIYLIDGNGLFDTALNANGFPSRGDFGNAFVKIAPTSPATVIDFFATHDTVQQSTADLDLGSGGLLLLPDIVDNAGKTWHLGLGSGKSGFVYVVDRDNMGKFDPSSTTSGRKFPYAVLRMLRMELYSRRQPTSTPRYILVRLANLLRRSRSRTANFLRPSRCFPAIRSSIPELHLASQRMGAPMRFYGR